MPRSLTSVMALVAWIAMIFGAIRWYASLDELDRGPVQIASGIVLIVGAIFALLLSPFVVADWIQDRKRENHRRWLRDQTISRR